MCMNLTYKCLHVCFRKSPPLQIWVISRWTSGSSRKKSSPWRSSWAAATSLTSTGDAGRTWLKSPSRSSKVVFMIFVLFFLRLVGQRTFIHIAINAPGLVMRLFFICKSLDSYKVTLRYLPPSCWPELLFWHTAGISSYLRSLLVWSSFKKDQFKDNCTSKKVKVLHLNVSIKSRNIVPD